MVNQIHHNFHHYVLLLCPALSNHQGQGNEGVVGQTLAAVRAVEDAIVVEKPQEERGGNTLVAEERATAKLVAQPGNLHHGVLVCGVERLFLRSIVDGQPLVVVVVERVEGVCVVHHHVQQVLTLNGVGHLLVRDGSSHHLHQLAQLAYLLLSYAVVDGKALDEVLLQYLPCPDTEIRTAFTLHAIANGDDDIEAIISNRLLHSINTQKMRVVILGDFFLFKHIINMFTNCLSIPVEQHSHLIGTKPHRLTLNPHVNLRLSVLRLIDDDFILHNLPILLQRYNKQLR